MPEKNSRICWYADFLNPIPPVSATRTDLMQSQDMAGNDEERNAAVEVLKTAKEQQKDDPISGVST